ncbi:MAG: metal ABC transporter ATP-binding protein [Sciscionella sp.]
MSATAELGAAAHDGTPAPAVSLRGAGLNYGDRTIWSGLDLDVAKAEFLVVLGPNGSGKTSLLKVLLGLTPLSAGEVAIDGQALRRGNKRVGYIPQQKMLAPGTPLRGGDLVGFGLDGHRWGMALRGRRERNRQIEHALDGVGARRYGRRGVGELSGGEQQRLRVAQALVGDPVVLLCDEPLLSLDLANQQVVSGLIDRRRREAGTAVVFVTHEINPVLAMADRVLYLVDGRFRIGTPEAVMNSAALSELYGARIDVLRVRDTIVVLGAAGSVDGEHHHVEGA